MKLFIKTWYSVEEFYDVRSSASQKGADYTRVKFMTNDDTVYYIDMLNNDAIALIENIARTIHFDGDDSQRRTAIVFDATKFLTYTESDDKSIVVM